MKQAIKRVVGFLVPRSVLYSNRFRRTDLSFKRSQTGGKMEAVIDILKYYRSHRFIAPNANLDPNVNAAMQFKSYAKRVRFTSLVKSPYFYPLDTTLLRVIPDGFQPVASLTQDYSKVLTMNLLDVKRQLSKNADPFSRSIVTTIEAIDLIRLRAIEYYKGKDDKLARYFDRLMDKSPESFDESLQKILFFNGLMWANRQSHIGLGRLDLILLPYLERDLKSGLITIDLAKEKIGDFVKILGSHTAYKSASLIGDTGQVMLISGTDRDGNYVENELTHIFLDVIAQLNIPDPKLIMRICDQTTTELWQKAIACVSKGNGSPLLANEPKIMTLMEKFGYSKSDIIDFGTSACWEPLIIGKSFDQNNCTENINLPKIIAQVTQKGEYISYDEFKSAFFAVLEIEVNRICENAKEINFDRSPLQSLWMDGCLENLRDISQGGANYNFHGFLCAGLPNAVNALLNIKTLVFEQQKYTLEHLSNIAKSNYAGNDNVKSDLIDQRLKFGLPEIEVVELTNQIMAKVSDVVSNTTINGNKAKVGFSSPSYMLCGEVTPATLDGRCTGEPFATHISPVSKDVDFAEIVDFASLLNYNGNKINGNVVDFVLSDQFAKNSDKFAHILRIAFSKGVYEMQLNVLNADQLIAAKANPKLYPNLVVRVWGFSAYFNDLPDSYKNHLIERALHYKSC